MTETLITGGDLMALKLAAMEQEERNFGPDVIEFKLGLGEPFYDPMPGSRSTLYCHCGREFKTFDGLQHHKEAKHPSPIPEQKRNPLEHRRGSN